MATTQKKIRGQINKVNVENIVDVVRSLLQENIIRGKGLFARSIIQAQSFSPSFSNVFAAVVAIINTKFPNVGELVLRRLVIQFKQSFRRNDKITCINVSKFIAHLANQRVAHEVIVLEMLVLLMQTPTDDSIEITAIILKESGSMLQKVTLMVHTLFSKGFVPFSTTVILSKSERTGPEDGKPYDPMLALNVFKFDPGFEKTEAEYEDIRKEIIGDEGESDVGQEEKDENMEGDDYVTDAQPEGASTISSLDFQEAAHKLIKNELKPNMESELCHMIVDCCAQQRTYERFYGLLSERFCKLNKDFQDCFERIVRDTYNAIHRFDMTKLRNMAKLSAHLLATDAISWEVLSEIKLTETDTTSAGRIFIKILFQELVEIMGLVKIYERACDATLQTAFEGIFPRDHPKNTRFAINSFRSLVLEGLHWTCVVIWKKLS
uniref:MI domain-containing protein n=1 Tax=Ditylenchus dipsaci TaxID=166011 RepID=A0A915DQF7_9BILA